MVLRARLRVAEKFHFRGASRANCRIATYKRISAGIVAHITLAVNSFTIRRALSLSLPVLAEKSTVPSLALPGSRASFTYHPSLGECISFSRSGIYHSVCGKIYEQPHREGGNCGREISPTAKNTCDRFCTPGFTILRGRGTSRAVNTFCATVDFFELSKIQVINPACAKFTTTVKKKGC